MDQGAKVARFLISLVQPQRLLAQRKTWHPCHTHQLPAVDSGTVAVTITERRLLRVPGWFYIMTVHNWTRASSVSDDLQTMPGLQHSTPGNRRPIEVHHRLRFCPDPAASHPPEPISLWSPPVIDCNVAVHWAVGWSKISTTATLTACLCLACIRRQAGE